MSTLVKNVRGEDDLVVRMPVLGKFVMEYTGGGVVETHLGKLLVMSWVDRRGRKNTTWAGIFIKEGREWATLVDTIGGTRKKAIQNLGDIIADASRKEKKWLQRQANRASKKSRSLKGKSGLPKFGLGSDHVEDFKAGWRKSKKMKRVFPPHLAYRKFTSSRKHGTAWIDGYAAWLDHDSGVSSTREVMIARELNLF